MVDRPFRFAVGGPTDMTRDQLREVARRAEGLGYSALLLPDHLGRQVACLPGLVAAAEATSRLRVGSLVLNNDLRHPAVLAHDAATVDRLSGGRLELGLGAGWMEDEYRRAGIGFDDAGVRIERLGEAVAIVKGLLAGETVTSGGRHYRVAGLELAVRPVQRPRPPLLLGGGSRKLLALAAREADIIGLAPRLPSPQRQDPASISAAATARKVAWIREAAGDRFDRIELNVYPVHSPVLVTRGAGPAAAAVLDRMRRRFPGLRMTVEELLDSPHVFIGPVERLVEKIVALRERFSISYVRVDFAALEPFAPVVERLAGR